MRGAMRHVEIAHRAPWTHPSWALEDDEVMPESGAHDEAARVLVSLLMQWVLTRGRVARVRRNLALRWDEEHPAVGVDPDVCLLDPAPAATDVELTSLRLWKPGMHPPRVAVEIVSERTAEKDYREGPLKYAASGTRELWVFDPQRFGPSDEGGPWVLQVWARGRDGVFRRVYEGDGPAQSVELDAWILVSEDGLQLRVSDDEEGTRRWPTAEEAAAQSRAAEAAALARVAELEALLAQSRGPTNT